jgi:hypothetical protein
MKVKEEGQKLGWVLCSLVNQLFLPKWKVNKRDFA